MCCPIPSRLRLYLAATTLVAMHLLACARQPDSDATTDAQVPADVVETADGPTADAPADATANAEPADVTADGLADVASVDAQLPETAGDVAASNGCPKPSATQPVHVLFIGNSYTAVNNLPKALVNLAAAAGRSVIADASAPGGFTLGAPPSAHIQYADTLAKLQAGGWDFVVLQEQSYLPTIPDLLQQTSVPGAKQLAGLARKSSPCVQILLYQTWARQKPEHLCAGSLCAPDFATWQAMQDALTAAYDQLAAAAQGNVVPVGEVWRQVREKNGELQLFAADGSHPSPLGTYAAAATFLSVLFEVSPQGLAPPADLDPAAALAVQKAAWTVVHAQQRIHP